MVLAFNCATADVPLVTGDTSRAVVVTAPAPSPSVAYATDELVEHVEKATGVRLPVTTQDKVSSRHEARVYIGDTKAARQAGVAIDQLAPDAFVLKAEGKRLFIAGKEDKDVEPLDYDKRRRTFSGVGGQGPLFGVYELLQKELGVRWLWPGELGTYVPRADAIVIPHLDATVSPKLSYRDYWLRTSQGTPTKDKLARKVAGGVVGDVYENYGKDVRVYARQHRQGTSGDKPKGGHGIAGIRMKDVRQNHPEWLAMNAEGERTGPRLCVSNPDLHKAIVNGWEGDKYLHLGGADNQKYCHCDECVAWDAPQDAEPGDKDYIVSDRYAKFWKRVYDLAAQKKPDVVVTTYLYVNYWPAPLGDIQLNENIHAKFVPWGSGWVDPVWFPKSREDFEWLKAQWLGWEETGITMYYRPNDVLSGSAMPALNTWQRGNFIRFAYRNGMRGMEVDSLIGHWAVRGPELYLYFRLMRDPEATVRNIRNDFFSAFGPAANDVEAYFDFWESYQYTLLERGDWKPHWNSFTGLSEEYPPGKFEEAKRFLEQASRAAERAERSDYADRVDFLMAGLEHARLCSRFVGAVEELSDTKGKETDTGNGDDTAFANAKEALSELLRFRATHQYPPPVSSYFHTRSLYGNEAGAYASEIESLLDAMEPEE